MSTLLAGPCIDVGVKPVNRILHLGAQIVTSELPLVDLSPAFAAVPSHLVLDALWSILLHNYANRVLVSNGAVRGVGREQKGLVLADFDVPELALVHNL